MTDLIILPNVSNGINNTKIGYRPDASATGVLYFDDGVSYKKNVSKTEIYYSFVGFDDAPQRGSTARVVQINFKNTGNYKSG